MDANGANPTRLTTDAGSDREPDWSPDGTKISFVTNRDGNDEIYVMDADGTNPTRMTTDDGRRR
jgi:TolB protein